MPVGKDGFECLYGYLTCDVPVAQFAVIRRFRSEIIIRKTWIHNCIQALLSALLAWLDQGFSGIGDKPVQLILKADQFVLCKRDVFQRDGFLLHHGRDHFFDFPDF